jgi:hypothetical protein
VVVEDTSGQPLIPTLSRRRRKRPRTSVTSAAAKDTPAEDTFGQPAADCVAEETSPIVYWIQEAGWPKEYFDQDDQTREGFKKDFKKDSWFEEYQVPETSADLSSFLMPSDQNPREAKSRQYLSAGYPNALADKGSFMEECELGAMATSISFCQTLLNTKQTFPSDSLFRDDIFKATCRKVRHRNETRVVRDILPLVAPSAENLETLGATHLKGLTESVNEGWNKSIPVTTTRPQPDYSVGFRNKAFTEAQLKKLQPFVGDNTENSFFMATIFMYFPFLTCEVKCGAMALDIADRQNAHSMTIAVRSTVELFKLVKREKELHREIIAFSISHDAQAVKIYGHYPVIDGDKTTFYCQTLRSFFFTEQGGKDKWAAYQFTRNVYDIWMPMHFKRICSVIDKLPLDVNFEVLEQSRLSLALESQHISGQPGPSAAPQLGVGWRPVKKPNKSKKSKKRGQPDDLDN